MIGQQSTQGRMAVCSSIPNRVPAFPQKSHVLTPARYHSVKRGSSFLTISCTATKDGQSVAAAQPQNKFVARLLGSCQVEDIPQRLQGLHSSCLSAAESLYMPTVRNEEYRFTDLSPLLKRDVKVPSPPSMDSSAVEGLRLSQDPVNRVVLIDGVPNWGLSSLTALPVGVYVGGLEDAPQKIVDACLGAQSGERGGPFATLNGALASEVVTIAVDEGVIVEVPIHVLNISTSSGPQALHASAPRLLVSCGARSSVEIIEEYASSSKEDSNHVVMSVCEIDLGAGANLTHGYVQLEGSTAVHMKTTLVKQGTSSSYKLTETSVGGSLTRHDVGIDQDGEETETVMDHFLLCGEDQLHDLHTRLKLEHPNGYANQLHKCIVSHSSGRGVFDGNVKVNQQAQKTDAGQLSRNLLLVPKATVNVKPNLQIIADDVKCTHGCAVSDLSEEELFYFRARGVDVETARQALVYSFGSEVVQKLSHEKLIERIQAAVKDTLASAGMA